MHPIVQGYVNGAVVGTKVRTLRDFVGVPKGTVGVIDENYEGGFMVAWNLLDQPLPDNYWKYDGRPAIVSNILRDGFSYDEAEFLEEIK